MIGKDPTEEASALVRDPIAIPVRTTEYLEFSFFTRQVISTRGMNVPWRMISRLLTWGLTQQLFSILIDYRLSTIVKDLSCLLQCHSGDRNQRHHLPSLLRVMEVWYLPQSLQTPEMRFQIPRPNSSFLHYPGLLRHDSSKLGAETPRS